MGMVASVVAGGLCRGRLGTCPCRSSVGESGLGRRFKCQFQSVHLADAMSDDGVYWKHECTFPSRIASGRSLAEARL